MYLQQTIERITMEYGTYMVVLSYTWCGGLNKWLKCIEHMSIFVPNYYLCEEAIIRKWLLIQFSGFPKGA